MSTSATRRLKPGPRAVRLGVLGLAAILSGGFPSEGRCADTLAMPDEDAAGPRTAIAFSAGGAWTDLRMFGSLRDSHGGVATASVELRHTFKVTDSIALEYLAAIVPVEVQGISVPDSRGGQVTGLDRVNVYGAGINPAGIGMRLGRGPWRPVLTLRGGVRIFDRRVPDPRSSRFNFVADLGLESLGRVGPSSWLSMGFGLHHVSNANLAESNRGINQFVVNLGIVRAR